MVGISLLIVAVCRGLEGLIKKGYVFHFGRWIFFPLKGQKNFLPILPSRDNLADRCVTAD